MSDHDSPAPPRNWLLVIAITSLSVIAAGIISFVIIHPGEVRTNDAQIDGHIHPINARVAGTIS